MTPKSTGVKNSKKQTTEHYKAGPQTPKNYLMLLCCY
jgi:hypothetical protein